MLVDTVYGENHTRHVNLDEYSDTVMSTVCLKVENLVLNASSSQSGK